MHLSICITNCQIIVALEFSFNQFSYTQHGEWLFLFIDYKRTQSLTFHRLYNFRRYFHCVTEVYNTDDRTTQQYVYIVYVTSDISHEIVHFKLDGIVGNSTSYSTLS